jgi:hypothetical protein
MNKLTIKCYQLKEFPLDGKVPNSQVGEIKRFYLNFSNDWEESLKALIKEIEENYSQNGKTFKMYWKDEDDELVLLSNYQDFKMAHDISNGAIRIYLIENKQQTIEEEIDFEIKIDKNIQKHPNVLCDGCNGEILGIRWICLKCNDYDLCDKCKMQGIHREHFPLSAVSTELGYDLCIECNKELTTNLNVCKDCTTEKLPEKNKLIAKRNLQAYTYTVCDYCKIIKHLKHTILTISVKDLIESNKRLANQIHVKRNRGEEIKSYPFFKCFSCRDDGSSLKAISYGYDGCYICADCLIEGKLVNIIKFAWLTQEDADYVRYQIHKQQNYDFRFKKY